MTTKKPEPFGNFTLLFCREWLRNVQIIITHVKSYCTAHLKPFVWQRSWAGSETNVLLPCCVNQKTFQKHLLRKQNVSEKIQKHFLRLGHKFCVRGQTGKHFGKHWNSQMFPQQCFFVCHDLYRRITGVWPFWWTCITVTTISICTAMQFTYTKNYESAKRSH